MTAIDPDSLAALPRRAGVYIFRGEGTLPVYIGKSVDIRSRVMSHLRAPEEAEMIAQTRRIDFIETAGEIGALLLEARLIKEQMPLFNIRLRRMRSLCAIRLDGDVQTGLTPVVLDSKDHDLATSPGLYGLFTSRHAAQRRLRELADQHRLCMALLGLEKTARGACFGLQIKQCLGACAGLEARAEHDQRLFSALLDSQVQTWPFAGAVDLVETEGDWVQRHRVSHWRYVGTWCSRTGMHAVADQPEAFDLDSYKILVKPIMLGTAHIEPVPA
jgi:excinuclease Cho